MTNRFNHFQPDRDSQPDQIGVGSFLIASPHLTQTEFEKSVIFVLQHNEHGTFGVVLNRPANSKIRSAWQLISGVESVDKCLVNGGPIGGPVFAIHRDRELAEMEIPGGIFVSSDSEKFPELIRGKQDFRIVFGVAGWQVGQLASEIEEGCWFPVQADSELVFDDPEIMWEELIREYGRQTFCDVVGIRELPPNPWVN